jgi:hypothetical protein
METLRHGNPYAHAPPVTISPPDCMLLSLHLHALLFISPPLTSMEKGNPHLRDCSPYLQASANSTNLSLHGASSCNSLMYMKSIQNNFLLELLQDFCFSPPILLSLMSSGSLWGRNYSKFLSQILKRFPCKRFGEDICNLLFCPDIL